MRKTAKDVLTWYIRQLLHLEKDIEIISDDGIIHLIVKGREFYLYIKSLTYAGNPYPQNTTRAQLPKRDEFDVIKASDAYFLFLGYDETNEVFACWDPIRTKERLNDRQYVSFFSRLNLQQSVCQGKVVSASLQNDFKYVLFKLNDLAYFLLNISDYFQDLVQETIVEAISEKAQGVLLKVEDDSSVKLLIDELYHNDANISTLSIISECMNNHGEFYYKMTLKDWHTVVNTYLSRMSANSSDVFESEIEESNNRSDIVAENFYYQGEENLLYETLESNSDYYYDFVFSHPIDWSSFEYGFTIDKKYHASIFETLGQYIPRGSGVDIRVSFDKNIYDAQITNADCQGRKGDTIRLLYRRKYNNLGTQLKNVETDIYSFIKHFKDLYGGRKQCTLPKNLQKTLVFKKTYNPTLLKMVINDLEDEDA